MQICLRITKVTESGLAVPTIQWFDPRSFRLSNEVLSRSPDSKTFKVVFIRLNVKLLPTKVIIACS